MKLKPEVPTTFTVELTKDEITLIREITQNALNINEDENQSKTRLSLFIGASKILGFDMNDDGSINRTSKL